METDSESIEAIVRTTKDVVLWFRGTHGRGAAAKGRGIQRDGKGHMIRIWPREEFGWAPRGGPSTGSATSPKSGAKQPRRLADGFG